MRSPFCLALLPLLTLFAAAAPAQHSATDPACANVRVAIPPELAGWGNPTPVSAGTKIGEGATIEIGKAALVSLHPAKHLTLQPAPGKGAAAEGNGGTLALAVTNAGKYRVALSGGAWIDLIHDGKAVASSTHAHGPKCSDIRKTVNFTLAPGNYAIQLSGNESDSIALLVAKLG